MTETPHGSRDAVQTENSSSPQVERPPYAGSEWRRPDAPSTPPQAGTAPETGAGHAVAPEFGPTDNRAPEGAGSQTPDAHSNGFDAPTNGAPTNGAPRTCADERCAGNGAPTARTGPRPRAGPAPFGGVPAGPQTAPPQYGATAHPGYGYGMPPAGGTTPPTNSGTWPYAAPEPKKPRPGGRLVAVGVLTAVLGGLAGGGLVAVLDRNDQTVAGGITVQGSSAPAAANQSGTAEAAAATAMKSVVTLSVRGQQEGGTGSGIVIRSDGYILTNEHVIAVADGGGSITVAFSDGRTAPPSSSARTRRPTSRWSR